LFLLVLFASGALFGVAANLARNLSSSTAARTGSLGGTSR
jgi:hypothetical protein